MKPPYAIHLRDAVSGARRVILDDKIDSDDDLWLWTDGNYACDCNRSLFLYDWAPEYKLPCGYEDGVIVIDGIYAPDGRKIYSETDHDPAD